MFRFWLDPKGRTDRVSPGLSVGRQWSLLYLMLDVIYRCSHFLPNSWLRKAFSRILTNIYFRPAQGQGEAGHSPANFGQPVGCKVIFSLNLLSLIIGECTHLFASLCTFWSCSVFVLTIFF